MMRLASLAVCATALQAPVRRRHLTRRQIAPSGVDGLPVPLQAVVFLGCAGGIGGGAVACNAALDTLRSATQKTGAGAEAWRKFVEYAFLVLGLLYVAAGVGHFSGEIGPLVKARNDYADRTTLTLYNRAGEDALGDVVASFR